MTLSLRTRLTLFCAATFAVLLGVVSAASYRLLARQLDLDATSRLTDLAAGLHGYLRFQDGRPSIVFDEADAEEAAFVHEATRYYQIYDAQDGRLLSQSQGLEALGLHFTPDEVRTLLDEPGSYDVETPYGRFRLLNNVVTTPGGERYLLQVGASLEAIDNTLTRYVELLLWRVLPSLLLVIVAAWWMAQRALAPLSHLAADARRIGIGTLDRRLPLRGTGDQLDEVAVAFNGTLERLETSVNEMRQFSAALAHELRTPLAALRGDVELGLVCDRPRDEARLALSSQIEEIDKLTRLINQLLTLARAESGEITVAHDPVDVAALASSIAEQLEPVAHGRGLTLTCAAPDPVIVAGDRGWLERMLLNLIDNALKFTPEPGQVSVSVALEGSSARIDVRDTGIGIARENLPHLFERFYRVDPARSRDVDGAGLGLSLVKWIVEGHGGHIDVDSRPGAGSTFTVRLPRTVLP